MPFVKRDDAEIYYEVHGDGAPFLFCSVTSLDHQAWKFHHVEKFGRDYRGTGKSSASDNSHWAAANQLARAIPNAKLVVLPGEGHHYLATNPAAAHKAIRNFID
jgi:hypothetical protein